jgi:hypothetical protein
VLDDGYGKRSLKHFGWKLNLAILEEVITIVRDHNGRFLHFMDKSTDEAVDSLDEIIKDKENFIEWKFENETLDNVSDGEVLQTRQGYNAATLDKWEHRQVNKKKSNVVEVKNKGSNPDGEWVESWTRKGKKKWALKVGIQGN